jgi:hypothetical protein
MLSQFAANLQNLFQGGPHHHLAAVQLARD